MRGTKTHNKGYSLIRLLYIHTIQNLNGLVTTTGTSTTIQRCSLPGEGHQLGHDEQRVWQHEEPEEDRRGRDGDLAQNGVGGFGSRAVKIKKR